MGQLTPDFLLDLESRMRRIQSRAYDRLLSNLVWTRFAKQSTMTGRREILTWLLDTARIDYVNELGGETEFDTLVMQTTEIESKSATGGLKLNRNQLDDHDGGGVQLAAEWSRGIGQYAAYWPQKQVFKALREGESTSAYDGSNFFATDHPVNPFDSSAGTYANIFTGPASGSYPGALPIDDSVTVDVALENLGKAVAYIASIPMPNGEDPRHLRVEGIAGPPRMMNRLVQLTNAQIIAQAAASGGGSANIESVVKHLGFTQPMQVDEFGAAFGGEDDSYYLLARDIGSDELGGVVYSEREPFSVIYHGTMTDAQLARANQLQWVTRGRNVVTMGHPFLIFKGKAS